MENKKLSLIELFQIPSIIILIFCIFFLIKWFVDNNNVKKMEQVLVKQKEFINETYNKKSNLDFTDLLDINNDTVAWIKVNNTNINYSVVKTDNNSFYLNHSFDKKHNNAGWIFADYRNKFDGTDKNVVLYGHSRIDGSMFYTLRNTLKKEWYENKENQIITLYAPNKIQEYRVFSVYEKPGNEIDIKTNFVTDSEYQSYLNDIKDKSIFDFNIKIDSDDSIITLSTCNDSNIGRIILHGVLIN